MKKLRVGVVGLGGIAQKARAAGFRAATDWTLQGHGHLPEKKGRTYLRNPRAFRMPPLLQDLARECDAVFVHSSTATQLSGGKRAARICGRPRLRG